LKPFKVDLHIHTCLSPCGDLKMSPRAIVLEAIRKGLDLIAICDHNSCENAAATIKASAQTPLKVLPGIEITTQEEVHICGLFDSIDAANDIQYLVYDHLTGENDETVFGMQVKVDADDYVVAFEKRLLIGAATLSVEYVVDAIHKSGGIAIAAHIDREGFGILGQLGFVPPALELDALEISSRMCLAEARLNFSEYAHYPFLQSSDAHFIENIGRAFTNLNLYEANFDELRLALKGQLRRGIIYNVH